MSIWTRWLRNKGYISYNKYKSSDNINYYNWRYLYDGTEINPETEWFTLFLKDVKHKKTLSFYSVFGNILFTQRRVRRVKGREISIFYTQENVSSETIGDTHYLYHDHLVGLVDLSLGFDYLDNPKYIRFPYWIVELIPPTSTYEDLVNICSEINKPNAKTMKMRKIDCSLIARHDSKGTRGEVADLLSTLVDISYEGSWRKNSNVLVEEFHDNKIEYLKNCKFNVCLENSNSSGYVTEKLFGALIAKTVPIYWGGLGNPEPELLNSSAFLYYDEKNPDKLFNEVDYLISNHNAYDEFINQEKMKDGAADIIYEKMNLLKGKIEELDG